MASYLIERTQFIPRPRAEVFAFFADAHNLERLTPPTLRFRILTPDPIDLRAGARIDYRLTLFGVPFGWRTLIEVYEPGHRFVDLQLEGPYRRWRHTHTFEDAPGGTVMHDRVEYQLPFGPLGALAHALLVRQQLGAIFDYRHAVVAARFPAASSAA